MIAVMKSDAAVNETELPPETASRSEKDPAEGASPLDPAGWQP